MIILCVKIMNLIQDSYFPFCGQMYIHLLAQCLLCPIRPPVFQLSHTYILVVLLILSLVNLHATNFALQLPNLISIFCRLSGLSR
jgi:hypothetical protein